MAIVINSLDVCAPGFERLRTDNEFILVIPVTREYTVNDVAEELNNAFRQTQCESGLSFQEMAAAIEFDFVKDRHSNVIAFPDLDPESGDEPSVYLFAYCENKPEITEE